MEFFVLLNEASCVSELSLTDATGREPERKMLQLFAWARHGLWMIVCCNTTLHLAA